MDLWAAYVLDRNYVAAEALLDRFPGPDIAPHARGLGMPDSIATALATAWLQRDGERLDALAAQAEPYIDAYRAEHGDDAGRAILGTAYLAAMGGDAEATERLLRRWNRTAGRDLAERIGQLDTICQMYGISGAAEAAVDCLRNGLEQPSYISPYMDVLWPFYDPVRDTPVFEALVTELGASTPAK